MKGNKQLIKRKIRWSLAIISLWCCAAIAAPLQTQYQFDLAPQPLIDALLKAAKQAKLQLLLPHETLKGISSLAIKGRMPLSDALTLLLKTHQLEYVLLSDNMLVIRPIASEEKTQKLVKQNQPKVRATPPKIFRKPSTDKISVIGYRMSMAESLLEKRNANVVSDVITQEEIGKFPDSNVAESMQRLSGVTLDRGEYISIRGADPHLSRVQINGRTVTTTTASNRDVSFPIFGSELFQTIKVIKSTSADMDEGGIAGTVSLETPKPLSIGKFAFGIEAGVNRASTTAQNETEHSLYLNQLLLDDTLGVYMSFSQQDSKSTEQFSEVKAWQTIDVLTPSNNTTLDIIGGLKQQLTSNEQQRDNHFIAVQWQATDGIQFYGDYFLSKRTPESTRDIFETQESNTKLLPIGELTHDQGIVNSAHYADMRVLQTTRIDTTEYYQEGASLKSHWLFEQWQFNTAAFYSKSGRDQNMELARVESNTNLSYQLNAQGQPPLFTDVTPPQWIFNKAQHQLTSTSDKEYALAIDADQQLDNELFSRLAFGVKHKHRKKTRQRQDKEFKHDIALDNYIQPFPQDTFTQSSNPGALTQWQSLNTHAVVQDELSDIAFEEDLTKYRHLQERTTAAFIMADIDTQIFDNTLRGNVGARWVTYNANSKDYLDEVSITGHQSTSPVQISHKFSQLLPSINLAFGLDDNNLLRLSAGKVLSYSNFGLLLPDTLLDIKRKRIEKGNANLQPNSGWQFDVAAEHYFLDEGLFGISLFYKNIDVYNERVTTTQTLDFGTGPRDFEVKQPISGSNAKLKGLELNVQTPFSFLSGFWQHFGIFANATFSQSERQLSTGEVLSLPGQANLASNVVLYWEKGGFSSRVTYNFRDNAISTRSGANGVDIYESPREYFDLSVRYRFTNGLRLSAEVLNLNKEPLYHYQNDGLHPIYASMSESRYYLGLGYTF